MRWPVALLIAVIAPGCDRVFGLDRSPDAAALDGPIVDLDGDLVPDEIDPCIATDADAAGDYDGDGRLNGSDVCPFNTDHSVDTDNDGIPNSCDPFPSSAGDRSRCVMTFASVSLASALWQPRSGEIPWGATPNLLHAVAAAGQVATVIAAESLEGTTTTTYHAPFRFDELGRFGSITLWLRADPGAPSAADIGCRYQADNIDSRMGVIGPNGLRDAHLLNSQPGTNTLRIAASVTTVGPNAAVICRFDLDGTQNVSMTNETLPAGRFGFSVDSWEGKLDARHVLDHP